MNDFLQRIRPVKASSDPSGVTRSAVTIVLQRIRPLKAGSDLHDLRAMSLTHALQRIRPMKAGSDIAYCAIFVGAFTLQRIRPVKIGSASRSSRRTSTQTSFNASDPRLPVATSGGIAARLASSSFSASDP